MEKIVISGFNVGKIKKQVEKVDEKRFIFICQNRDDRNRTLNAKIEMCNRILLYNKYIKRIYLEEQSGLSY